MNAASCRRRELWPYRRAALPGLGRLYIPRSARNYGRQNRRANIQLHRGGMTTARLNDRAWPESVRIACMTPRRAERCCEKLLLTAGRARDIILTYRLCIALTINAKQLLQEKIKWQELISQLNTFLTITFTLPTKVIVIFAAEINCRNR